MPVVPPPLPPSVCPPALPKPRKLPLPLLLGGLGALALLALILGSVLAYAVFSRRSAENASTTKVADVTPIANGAGNDVPAGGQPMENPPKPRQPADEDKRPGIEEVPGREEPGNDGVDGPPLLLQVHSLDRLFAVVKILGAEIKKSQEIEQLFQVLRTSFGEEGLPGIDPKRPWGAYAQTQPGEAPGWPVGLIPIRDEDNFLRLLHSLQCATTKNADGVYVVEHPKITRKVGFRFANRHAYVAVDRFDALDNAKLVEPAKVFVRDEADVRATFRIDRIPQARRAADVATMRRAVPQMMAKLADPSPAQRAFVEKLLAVLLQGYEDLLDGGRDLSLSLRVDADTRKIAAALELTGKKDSRLSRSLTALEETPSLFGDLSVGQPAMLARFHFRLPEELRPLLGPLAREATDLTLRDAKDPQDRAEGERFLRALEPTIAAGEVDAALMLRSLGEGKPIATVVGLKVAKGLELEKVIREMTRALPEEKRRLFQFDVGKIGEANIHSMAGQRLLPPEAEQVFGPNPFYYGFRQDALLAAGGANGQESIRQALENKSGPVPMALLELNVRHLIEMRPGDRRAAEAAKTAFTDANPGRVRVVLQNGPARLRLGLDIDLALLRFAADMGLVQFNPQIQVKQP